MDVVTGWTGRTACALQAALRMSNDDFARHLDIGTRTVADWHNDPGIRPRPEKQQLLDTALAWAMPEVKERFTVLSGMPPPALSVRDHEDDAAADAERRLIADENISGALGRLDEVAGWPPGTARRRVAARMAGLDRRDLLDRTSRRRRVGRRSVAEALGGYHHAAPDGTAGHQDTGPGGSVSRRYPTGWRNCPGRSPGPAPACALAVRIPFVCSTGGFRWDGGLVVGEFGIELAGECVQVLVGPLDPTVAQCPPGHGFPCCG
jgi:hypothetical protein